MTMLDRMRRHKSWLKWSLALVVLTFVIFYIPDFLRGDRGGSIPSDQIATVAGRPVSVAEFRRAYQSQIQAYRSAYGSNVSEQLLKQLGIEQQVLQQMVDEVASTAEAERLGIKVGDEEIQQRILSIPAFQQNGQFIGEQQYRNLLGMQRPPMTPGEFESSLSRSLMIEKLRAVLTDWITVSEQEADTEYTRRNQKVKIQLVTFSADTFRKDVTASDAEIAAYFEKHKETYRVGERRKIRYLVVDVDKLRPQVVVTSREIERSYNGNIEMYSTPEQVRASHILLKTAGKDEATIRKAAEKILAEAKSGADFAALAKKYSEDEQSAKQGGDLDYFGRGRMLPEFEQAAFTLQPGTISDLVKTTYGFHIIKVVDKKAASTRSLEEVRAQIQEQLAMEKAQKLADSLATEVAKQIGTPADLDKVAAARGWKVQESGFFTREEPVMDLGASPQLATQVFAMKEGDISPAIQVSRGLAFVTVTGKQAPALPSLTDVRDRVRDDTIKEKAKALSLAKAISVASSLKTAADFAAAAKKAGLEAKSSELVARGAALPDIGISPAIDKVAFGMTPGTISDPIETANGTAVIKLLERTDVTPAQLASGREATRQELLNDRRGKFFSAYMVKAKLKMGIEINREVLDRVISGA
jgi:peptidyl-prolyl cis-trans isomerase D